VVATDITSRRRAEKEVSTYLDQLTTLRLVDAELNRKLEMDYVLEIALDAAMNLSGASHGFIGLIERDEVQLARKTRHYPADITSAYRLERGILARVIRQKQAEWVAEVSADPDYFALIPDTRSQMSFPLVTTERQVVGALSLETHDPNRFSREAFDVLRLLTARVTVALDNARLFEITQQQLAELEARNRELDAYSYTIAHDLKAPLSVMVTYASLLMRAYRDLLPEKGLHFLEGIKASALNMGQMIEQLLKLAKLRDASAAAEAVKVRPVVESALTRFKDQLELKQVRCEIAPDLPAAWGHEPWLEEVFANLIGNAIKYMGADNQQPRIQIRGGKHNGQARFEVADNGIGIDPENQTRLFEMFTRVRDVEAEGLGLGLSIVHRIVTKLKGQVGVESEKGKGSTFWFTLPAAD
jgi:signal transduction histidine kinase